jgi:hypothetical protein
LVKAFSVVQLEADCAKILKRLLNPLWLNVPIECSYCRCSKLTNQIFPNKFYALKLHWVQLRSSLLIWIFTFSQVILYQVPRAYRNSRCWDRVGQIFFQFEFFCKRTILIMLISSDISFQLEQNKMHLSNLKFLFDCM